MGSANILRLSDPAALSTLPVDRQRNSFRPQEVDFRRLIMNARSSSLQRPTLQSPTASPTNATAHAPAITSVAHDSHAAANENGLTAAPDDAVNPLWMI